MRSGNSPPQPKRFEHHPNCSKATPCEHWHLETLRPFAGYGHKPLLLLNNGPTVQASGLSSERHRDRLTFLFPSGKIPCIGKSSALNRLHLLNAAFIPIQHYTFAARIFIDERESRPVRPDSGKFLDKIMFSHSKKGSNLRNLRIL